jgi:hypothetical protein
MILLKELDSQCACIDGTNNTLVCIIIYGKFLILKSYMKPR